MNTPPPKRRRHRALPPEGPVTQVPYGTTSYEEISKALSYDYRTGFLTWKVRPRNHFSSRRAHSTWNAQHAGDRADLAGKGGYTFITVFRKKHPSHRVIHLLMLKYWPPEAMDHCNGRRSDNRWRNLRRATREQNAHNSKKGTNNTSGCKRVTKSGKSWRAELRIGGVHVYRETFKDFEAAVAAIRKKRVEHHGYYANHG